MRGSLTGLLPLDFSDPGQLPSNDTDSSPFVAVVVLLLVLGIAVTVVKVSLARGMARRSGMSQDEATAMTLLTDDGLEATYLSSNLREPAKPAENARPASERLAELDALKAQGLITADEYAARRTAILDSI